MYLSFEEEKPKLIRSLHDAKNIDPSYLVFGEINFSILLISACVIRVTASYLSHPVTGCGLLIAKGICSNNSISDFLKLLSLSPGKVTHCPSWKFTVTKDDKNPVVIHFDTVNKIKRAATPAFLMALVLKEHVKAIKAKTGVTPTELGFAPFFGYQDDEILNVKKGLDESCRLLEIRYIFVDLAKVAEGDEI